MCREGAPDSLSAPHSIAIGDFNLDGKPDLATANATSNNVTILLNTCEAFPCGNMNFSQPKGSPIGAGTSPFFVAVGDFNLDGKADLATANANSHNLTILLGNGSGGFTQPSGSPVGTGHGPASVAVSDFNQDGKPDLAVANSGSNNVTILLGDGSGGFTQPAGSPVGMGAGPYSIAIGDFNQDGKADLAMANYFSNNVTILLGNGSGGFIPTGSPIGTGFSPRSIAVGDFNLDGKFDLATANSNSNNVTILLGNGSGGFTQAAGSPVGTGNGHASITIGDFNQDGKPDLATTNFDSSNATILLGDGSGGFTQPSGSPVGVGGNPVSIAVGDFNQDGKADLAIANFHPANVIILLGNGSGGFTQAAGSPVGTGFAPASVVVGDFNQDGKPDLATANQADGNVTIQLNTCTPNTPPTITANGVTRTAGNPSANSQIATVSDVEDAEETLSVTVNGGASATVNGVIVNNLSVSAKGVVTADVVAACGAMTANFTLRVTDSGGLFNEATLIVTVNPDNQPPSITCPANQTRVLVRPTDPTVVVTYPTPTFSDNCAGASVACLPPSGAAFPVGTTTVTCTATDAAGNTATCSFTVTTFDVCLQDDSDATTVLLFNSFTGDYRFCCRGTIFTGKGTVQKSGSTYTLTHNTADRRVTAKLEIPLNRGTASLQSPVGTPRCSISDRDTRNNSCLCQ